MADVRLLVVEDEEHLATGIRFNLELEGYAVEVLGDGKLAMRRLAEAPGFDLVILDVMLPGLDGFAVCRKLREAGNFVPILMLTAKSLPEDVVSGLEAGADDYLAKPFELEVFLARVRGLLRRRDWARNGGVAREGVVQIGPAEIDFEAFEVRRDGAVHRLTLLEAALLRLLWQNPGRVVSKGEILEKVWNLAADTETRAVDNFIVRLRRYLEDDSKEPKRIVTVRGAGWKLVPD